MGLDRATMKTTPAKGRGGDAALDSVMEAYLDGDTRAFAELFDELSPRIYRYLARATGNAALAEDLVQTTFLKVHRARDQFRRGDSVAPWVFAIAQNCLRDELRSDQRRLSEMTSDGEHPRNVAAPVEFGTRQSADLVQRALMSLSDDQRQVVLLHKVEGLSMEEISTVLGISCAAARVRAHRGYKAIATFVEEHGA
jgi:RNA polymerase sigma-70 factor (ECF subfamily)